MTIWDIINFIKTNLASIIPIIIALISLFVALRALNVTRRTQRPFLNAMISSITTYNNPGPNTIQNIVVHINNRGNYPADEFHITCGISKKAELNNVHYLVAKDNYPLTPTIIFPGEGTEAFFEENPKGESALKFEPNDVIFIRVTLSYMNRLTNENHKTVKDWKSNPLNPSVSMGGISIQNYWN
jgi:hypothetical protein